MHRAPSNAISLILLSNDIPYALNIFVSNISISAEILEKYIFLSIPFL